MRRDPDLDHHVEMASLDAAGFGSYHRIFDANGMPRIVGELEWRYQDNPAHDSSVISFAIHEESRDLAAVYAMMGVTFLLDGMPRKGVQSLDTLTDRYHRRKGLFPYLAERTYAQAAEDGCLAVYGFPNENSYPVFDKHLGWDIYGPVDFLVRPLRTGYVLSRLLGRIGLSALAGRLDFALPIANIRQRGPTFRTITTFSDVHEEIWRENARAVRIAVDRSAAYLNWRIFGRPDGAKYRAVEAVAPDGTVEGFVIWTVEEKHGGRIGYLMECLTVPGRTAVHKALLKTAVREMSSARADVILAWGIPGQQGTRALRKTGFFTLPVRLRPIQLYWGCRVFGLDMRFSASDWYISYLDSDTV